MNNTPHHFAPEFDTRPMTESDLSAACALWAVSEGVELAEGDSLAELGSFLRRNPGTSQVVVLGGEVVGALLAGSDGRRGYLYHLAVRRDHRRRGLASKMVEKALAALRGQGLRRVLILVARGNQDGRQFWLRNGWEALGIAEPMGIDL